jgi:hypothetical protein
MKAVLIVLADATNSSGQAFPSQQRIAEITELSERAVRYALDGLEGLGLISREPRYRKGGSRKSTLYKLTIPATGATMPEGKDTSGNDLEGIPATGATMPPPYRQQVPPCEGTIPATGATLVTTLLEPTDKPPVVPLSDDGAENDLSLNGGKHRGSKRCPKTFTPTAEHRKLAANLGLDFDMELAKMRDHEFREPRRDWDAVFRNWLRNSKPPRATAGRAASHRLTPDRFREEVSEGRGEHKTRMQIEHEQRLRKAGKP